MSPAERRERQDVLSGIASHLNTLQYRADQTRRFSPLLATALDNALATLLTVQSELSRQLAAPVEG